MVFELLKDCFLMMRLDIKPHKNIVQQDVFILTGKDRQLSWLGQNEM